MLLREIIELDQQGAEAFFGEPELDIADLMRTTADGQGVISVLELAAVQDKPGLFSTFLMWLLAELFHELPEVGDLDTAQAGVLLRRGAPAVRGRLKEFLDQVAQTVRLIRSKGVGVFFVTQLPDDVPDAVLAQLGNRVQHALRAFTPRDAKALKAAVTTYPEDRRLRPRGGADPARHRRGDGHDPLRAGRADAGRVDPHAPADVAHGRVPTEEVDAAAKATPLWATYATEVDRESAREKLAAKLAASAADAPRRRGHGRSGAKKAGGPEGGGAKKAGAEGARRRRPGPTTATRSPTSSSHARVAPPSTTWCAARSACSRAS